jgi:mono/diheme cytochrome c family protein
MLHRSSILGATYRAALALALATTYGTATRAEPPSARHTVQAVADVGSSRILVRWLQVEGAAKRFQYHEVLRREASGTEMVTLTAYPIGPATTVAGVEAIFNTPGYEDALAEIVETLGAGYATELLRMQSPAASDDDRARLRLLPDLNYGAAVALGLGLVDDTAVSGTRYVYEVWGVGTGGLRVERIGRASATSGAPDVQPAAFDLACVDRGDVRGDMSVHLRWDAYPPDPVRIGQDVFRVMRNPDPPYDCPPIEPGQPGTERANAFLVSSQPAGKAREGERLYGQRCMSCHTGSLPATDPRDIPPSNGGPAQNGVQGSTIHTFARTLDFDVLGAGHPHQSDPELRALSGDDLQALYEYVHEFQFLDDGSTTPGAPLEEGETYCYEVRSRTIFGHHGAAPLPGSVEQAECQVRDRQEPSAPYGVRAERIVQGSLEICRLSWEANSEPDDDTVAYRIYRMPDVPRLRRDEPAPTALALASIAQPAGGGRIYHDDLTLAATDMGESWFYGVRAFDDAQNPSRFSAWVPCVPRDIVPPAAPTLDLCQFSECPCRDLGTDPGWLAAGGDPDVHWLGGSDRSCPVLQCNAPGDSIGCRLYRSFDGTDYAEGQDFSFPDDPAIDFRPTMDQQVFIQARAYDASGNQSGFSPPTAWLIPGDKPLPAPQIVDVISANPGPGFVKIRFRSLQPGKLLGFSLHRTIYPDQDPDGATDLVERFPDTNLGGVFEVNATTDRVWFAKKAGAVAIEFLPDFIRTTDPPGLDTFLYYNDLTQMYTLQLDVGDVNDLVLQLRAVGWTGEEGLGQPYVWDGWQARDGLLDWPEARDLNLSESQAAAASLQVTWVAAGPRMELEWTAWPAQPCSSTQEPFIVYRRPVGTADWYQLSVPFGCDASTAPTVRFHDTDVIPGRSYSYRVIRLDDQGEFQVEYGPVTRTAQ